MLRNADIEAESDMLFAAPNGPEYRRSGTWATIRMFRNEDKPLLIVYPDGDMQAENIALMRKIEVLFNG
jgi:hypothetical protein